MPDETVYRLMLDGVYAAKAGQNEQARRVFERVINLTTDRLSLADAWYWLSQVAADPQEKRACLESALSNDMNHTRARLALAILDGKLKPEEIVNPDSFPASSSAEKTLTARRFTCPACGGRMSFAPDGQTLVCESCQSLQAPKTTLDYNEQDFLLAMSTAKAHKQPIVALVFHCQGCAADFIFPPQVMSASCSFCGSNHVAALDQERELISPDALVPMRLDQHQAAWKLVEWVEKEKIPVQGKVEAPRGVYLPVWTFNIAGEIPWNGQVYRSRRWVSVSGTRTVAYNHLALPACKDMADLLKKALPEFGLSTAPAYDPAFLSGWPAEVYQESMAESALEARRLAAMQTRQAIVSEEGMLDDLTYSTASMHVESFNLILVPVWVTRLLCADETCRVLINGLNGVVHAEKPRHLPASWLEKITDS